MGRARPELSAKPRLVGNRFDASGLPSTWSQVRLLGLDGSVQFEVSRPGNFLSVPSGVRGTVVLEWTAAGTRVSARYVVP